MTHYDCLGVPRTATLQEIDLAYRRALQAMPQGGFRLWLSRTFGRGPEHLTEAWTVLRDDEARRAYDERLAFAEHVVWMAPGH